MLFLLLLPFDTVKARNAQYPVISIDATHSASDREGQHQIFSGHVVAIAAGTLLTADHVELDRESSRLSAHGHVILMNHHQVLSGDSLLYDLLSHQFTLTDAVMRTNDPRTAAAVADTLLGFSEEELSYEAARRLQLDLIAAKKTGLQEQYRTAVARHEIPDAEITTQYILLLEKEKQISSSQNPALNRHAVSARENLERRRLSWLESQAQAPGLQNSFGQVGFFSLEGDLIRQVGEDQFEARDLFLTPCMCQQGESAPWGFRASFVEAMAGGYANLRHPVLEIKGIPVLYLPWLRIPVKSKRQSGFLLPGISHSSVNGNMYSQPVYFAFNDEMDATLVTDLIEKRGVRLGLEYRVQNKQYSGWTFGLEGIRDKLWLEQAVSRERLIKRYTDGMEAAAAAQANGSRPSRQPDEPISLSDPAWWHSAGLGYCLEPGNQEKCREHEIRNQLKLPLNSWRGQFEWKGMTVIAPRLTLVSHGLFASDHSYSQDLWVPGLAESLSSSAPLRLSAPARFRIHLDASDFYAGLGSDFSDPYLALERFSGYQIPFNFRLQSRMISLLPDESSLLPLYFQIAAEQKRIETFREAKFSKTLPANMLLQRLGNGNWRRVTGRFSTPLASDQIFNADYFADLEYRGIETAEAHQTGHRLDPLAEERRPELYESTSSLTTMRSGFHFSLPLEGVWALPAFLSSDEPEQKDSYSVIRKRRKVRHTMNWHMTMATRPWVGRRGEYGESSEYLKFEDGKWVPSGNSKGLTYFPSDRDLQPSQELIFATSQDWETFDEIWRLLPGAEKPSELQSASSGSEEESLRERARRELWFSLDQAVSGSYEMYAPDGTWYANRYQLTKENERTPLHLESKISYDYKKQKLRDKLKEEAGSEPLSSRLPEPWSPLVTKILLNMSKWSLRTENTWNFYSGHFTNLIFDLSPPLFFGFSSGLTYQIEKSEFLNREGDIDGILIKTLSASLGTELIPHVGIGWSYGVRVQPDQDMLRRSAVSSSYTSPSGCWGLRFTWEKTFDDPEWTRGSYYLGLVVKFMTQERWFGNMTSRYNPRS